MLKDFEGGAFKDKEIENEIEVLYTYTLMEKVIQKLNLDIRYFKPATFGMLELYETSPVKVEVVNAYPVLYNKPLVLQFPNAETVLIDDKSYPLNKLIETPYGSLRILTKNTFDPSVKALQVQVMSLSSAAGDFIGRLSVKPTSESSSVLKLTLTDAFPERGKAVLNDLIAEYNKASVEDKKKGTAQTLEFINSRLALISGELSAVEKSIENYKSENGITDLGSQAESFLSSVKDNDSHLSQIDIQLASLDNLVNFVNSQPANRSGTPATLGLSDPLLVSLIQKMTQLEMERDQIARTTSPKNPMLQTIDSQILATRANIIDNIETMKEMLLGAHSQYKDKNKRMEEVIRTIPVKERRLLNITRQQLIKNNLYTYLLQKREETAITYGAVNSDARTLDLARSSGTPVKPVKSTIFVLFGMIGLLLPVLAIAGKELFNNRISSRQDVEATTPIPIMGEIVRKRQPGSIIVPDMSVAAEQIQMLRTNLQLARNRSGAASQVLLITSSISGEGKSFLTLNLGASLSMINQPTVILEMDLRRPTLRKMLGMENGPGINDYLNGVASLDDVLQPIAGLHNYYLIPSGSLVANPTVSLSSPRLAELIEELRQRFAYVLIDTPPSGLVTDAQLVAPFADTTLYLIRHNVTPKDHLRVLNSHYNGQKFQNLNIVLNGIGEDDNNYYSYTYRKGYSYKRLK